MGDDPVHKKVECKEVDPCENSRAVHISPHNSGTVIDGENSSAFQQAISQGRASLLTSPEWCSDAQICRFFRINFDKQHYKYTTKFNFVWKLPAIGL